MTTPSIPDAEWQRMSPEQQAAVWRGYYAEQALRQISAQMSAYQSGRTVTKTRRETSHLLHLVLTMCTAGLWAPVWIWMTIQHKIGPRKKSVTR